jgi:histidine triad (HIT) family protein
MIINGDLPGRFVYRDDRCVAFLTIEPLSPGHTLVVPIEEVDHWIDLEPGLASHLFTVAQRIGRAIDVVYRPTRVGLIIAGLEVPHVHLHVVGIHHESDLNFANADRSPDPEVLDEAATQLTAAINR